MKKPNKKIILHITPHLGGGVGRVLLNYLARVKDNPDFLHQLISLEYANEKAQQASKSTGFFLRDKMSADHEGILNAIAQADIVLIHWWNHPLLNAFLVREAIPPSRIIFWSHVSGFHAPYVFTEPALNYPDLFVFTSPLSYQVQEIKRLTDARQTRLRDIWSTGGVEHAASIRPRPHDGFKIGYIGTVDYGKMHPYFLKMSGSVRVPEADFIVCGGPSEKQIQEEARQQGMAERFLFPGQVNDIAGYLSEFDIFGYPLAPYHYGTCEQSLGESMAAGVPPVVLSNPAETCIVKDGITGMVASDEDGYARAIETLYANPELRRAISCRAKEDAVQRFSLDLMINSWEKVFDEILRLQKSKRSWTGRFSGKNVSPAQILLESLGEYGREFACTLNPCLEKERKSAIEKIKKLYKSSCLWRSNTRGTPKHYHYFFPEDPNLINWISFMDNE